MPLLFVLGALSVFGLISYVKDGGTPSKAHTPEEIERMSKEMVGKSKSECRKILNKYR